MVRIARALGVDVGRRRIGLAISDATGTLARPLATITSTADGGCDGVAQVAREVVRLAAEDDGLCVVVVGVPSSLDGTPTRQTRQVTSFMESLRSRVSVPIVGEDERLTSREAEERLALRERDWRKRKLRLDAAAAAIMLQDFLDRGAPPAGEIVPGRIDPGVSVTTESGPHEKAVDRRRCRFPARRGRRRDRRAGASTVRQRSHTRAMHRTRSRSIFHQGLGTQAIGERLVEAGVDARHAHLPHRHLAQRSGASSAGW